MESQPNNSNEKIKTELEEIKKQIQGKKKPQKEDHLVEFLELRKNMLFP